MWNLAFLCVLFTSPDCPKDGTAAADCARCVAAQKIGSALSCLKSLFGQGTEDGEMVNRLITIAKCKVVDSGDLENFKTRIAALEALSNLRTTDANAIIAMKVGLKALLSPSGVEEYQKDYFRFHVIKAMASLGYKGRELIPDLAGVQSTDKALNKAVQDAIRSILASAPPKSETPKAQTADALTKEYVANLIKALTDAKAKACDRISAATALAALGKDALCALADLDRIANCSEEKDPDLKLAAKAAAKKIRAALRKSEKKR